MGTSKFTVGVNPVMDWHPIQGGGETLLVASCYRNQDKLQPPACMHTLPTLVDEYIQQT